MLICPGCNRHVREDKCPFCGTAISATDQKANARGDGLRLGHGTRAALALGVATTALGATLSLGACSSSSTVAPVVGSDAAYGGPPQDKDSSASPAYGIAVDAAYGGPPLDDGSVSPAYGIAVDASSDDASSDQ